MSNIRFRWYENGRVKDSLTSREDFKKRMKSIMDRYEGNNEISSRLYKISDEVEWFEVDKNKYKIEDIPIIYCHMKNGNIRGISINKKYHPMMWGIILEYCK